MTWRNMKRGLIILGCLILAFVASLFLWPRDPIEACLDWGGRWNYKLESCECTDEKRSRRGFSEKNKEYCEAPPSGNIQ